MMQVRKYEAGMEPNYGRDQPELTEAGDIHQVVKPSDQFVRQAILKKVVDGDTLRLLIDLGWGANLTHDIRLAGLNTPEVRGQERPAGLYVTERVKDWLGISRLVIKSHSFKLGKYGRCICEVWTGDGCLNQHLLNNGLAWPADENGKVDSRDLSKLVGIPQEVREQSEPHWVVRKLGWT